MVVDFEFRKSPSLRLATVSWKGTWNEKRIRSEFEGLEKWARTEGHRTGKWVFMEPGNKQWRVGIEVRGKAKGKGRIRLQTLPASRIACVNFDPEQVSPRIVYHGLNDWLRWRKREKKIRSVVSTREVYRANPWTDRRAWARTEVQFVVR